MGEQDLINVLTYHAIPRVLPSFLIPSGKTDVLTLFGATLEITNNNRMGAVFVNGVAKVVNANILANNGIVHKIDRVLIPPYLAEDYTYYDDYNGADDYYADDDKSDNDECCLKWMVNCVPAEYSGKMGGVEKMQHNMNMNAHSHEQTCLPYCAVPCSSGNTGGETSGKGMKSSMGKHPPMGGKMDGSSNGGSGGKMKGTKMSKEKGDKRGGGKSISPERQYPLRETGKGVKKDKDTPKSGKGLKGGKSMMMGDKDGGDKIKTGKMNGSYIADRHYPLRETGKKGAKKGKNDSAKLKSAKDQTGGKDGKASGKGGGKGKMALRRA